MLQDPHPLLCVCACSRFVVANLDSVSVQVAGFALHKKYGSQFMKLLDVILRCFLPALKEQGSRIQAEAASNLQNYLTDKVYLEEPEGQYLAQQLLSKELFT
jgi:nucleoporin GLE1